VAVRPLDALDAQRQPLLVDGPPQRGRARLEVSRAVRGEDHAARVGAAGVADRRGVDVAGRGPDPAADERQGADRAGAAGVCPGPPAGPGRARRPIVRPPARPEPPPPAESLAPAGPPAGAAGKPRPAPQGRPSGTASPIPPRRPSRSVVLTL